jgi:hypothetical protein
MDNSESLGGFVKLRRFSRKYSGEFTNPREFHMQPVDEDHTIAYWSLEVQDTDTEDGKTSTYYSLHLASLRGPGVMRSAFGEHYYSTPSSTRLSLSLVPEELLEAISETTGETILFD